MKHKVIAISTLMLILLVLTLPSQPTVHAEPVYTCTVVRRICWDIWQGVADMCYQSDTPPETCAQQLNTNVARCVSQSSDGECSWNFNTGGQFKTDIP